MFSYFTLFNIILIATCGQNLTYFVDNHVDTNNIYDAVGDKQSSKYIKYLGQFKYTQDCINECIKIGQQNASLGRCETYTYSLPIFKHASECYGRFGYPLWIPIAEKYINSGRIIWQCTSDMDCSLNGQCNLLTGNCSCRIGWKGYKCESLNLLPASKTSGYFEIESDGLPTSSWGGSVIVDSNDTNELTKYHMFLCEFVNHCGINSWTLNSRISHAQSINGWNGPFKRLEIMYTAFASEPGLIRGPNGEYVMYYTHYNYGNHKYCNCSDGSTDETCHYMLPPAYWITSMVYSNNSINGPWSLPMDIWTTSGANYSDLAFAAVILSNGSVIGSNRHFGGGGSSQYLVLANNWLDKNSYKEYLDNKMFPELTYAQCEDFWPYIDCAGNYHALFHNNDPDWEEEVCGGHAFSENGIDWIYTGVAYNNIIKYNDNSQQSFKRRERPHLIFDNDGCTPVALINAAIPMSENK
eukprot:97844_1